MNTLIAQVYEGGAFHENAITQKRGLVNAFLEYGGVEDFDYLANDRATLFEGFRIRINNFQPDVVFTQFHAADIFTPEQIRELRALRPEAKWCNWSGDSWAWSLTSPAMLELAKQYDAWLVAAPDTLPTYAEHGINAHFWQIAHEPSVVPLPDMPVYDVVFMGNVISDKRRALLEFLRTLDGVSVGIYGDWEHSDGHNTYAFAEGEALYRNAALAIADHAYPHQAAYVSNRPIQILAAGGALLLHQNVEKMDVLLGIEDGVHYVAWQDFDDLAAKIHEWRQPSKAAARQKIVTAGQQFALANHSWGNRVTQLLGLLVGEPTIVEEKAQVEKPAPAKRVSKPKAPAKKTTKARK